MLRTQSGIYQSQLFNEPSIIHGFCSKRFGDMMDAKNRTIFLSALGLRDESLICQEQIHGDTICRVTYKDRGSMMRGVDGMIYSQASKDPTVLLSVHTADCAPLFTYDPIERIIGCAHAGWKGTVLHIGLKLIRQMETLGSLAQNIRAVIGPRISVEYYTVDSNRADLFRSEFPGTGVVVEKKGKYYADIGYANYRDLITGGVTSEHIDYDPALCTYRMERDFFSFRRSGKNIEGEMLGVIGFR